MAVYKATYCYPFLNSLDARVVATESAPNPALYFKCKIDSSNQNVTGYKIRILDSLNNVIFPKENIEKISPINELPSRLDNQVNTGINGTYLNISFFQNNINRQYNSYNTLYYDVEFKANYYLPKLIGGWHYSENNKNILLQDDDNFWDGQLENDEKIQIGDILFIEDKLGNNLGVGDKCGLWQVSLHRQLIRCKDCNNNYIIADILKKYNIEKNRCPNVLITNGVNHNMIYTYDIDEMSFNKREGCREWVDILGNSYKLNMSGAEYKWEITLYQGVPLLVYNDKLQVNENNYNDLSSEWYQNILTRGQIVGSNNERIQIASDLTDDAILPGEFNNKPLVLKGKFIELLNNKEKIVYNNRIYVQDYDYSLGHVYLKKDELTPSDMNNNIVKCQFFKNSNQLGDLKAGEYVTCASTQHLDFISNGASNIDEKPTTIDGVKIKNGDLVLIKDQNNPKENGVYVVDNEGERWRRSGSFNNWGSFIGAVIFIANGTINGGKNFQSQAKAGGKLYNYDETGSGDSSLIFIPEKPLLIFDNLLDYNVDYLYESGKLVGDLKVDTMYTKIEGRPEWITEYIDISLNLENKSFSQGIKEENLVCLIDGNKVSGQKEIHLKREFHNDGAGDSVSIKFLYAGHSLLFGEKDSSLFSKEINITIVVNNSPDTPDEEWSPGDKHYYNFNCKGEIEEINEALSVIDYSPIKIGDLILTYTKNTDNDYSYKILKINTVNPLRYSVVVNFKNKEEQLNKNKYYIKINKGTSFGDTIVKVTDNGGNCSPTMELSTGYILKNSNTVTYISPYINLQEGQILNFQDSICQDQSECFNNNFIKIKKINKKFWRVEHDPICEPLSSFVNKFENTPLKYELRSFFMNSNENPFNLYESPYLHVDSEDGIVGFSNIAPVAFLVKTRANSKKYEQFTTREETKNHEDFYLESGDKKLLVEPEKCSEPSQEFMVLEEPVDTSYEDFYVLGSLPDLTAYTGRKITLIGKYIQPQKASWESYRWVLKDFYGNILQDTGVMYDKEMKVSFYGLTGEEKDFQNYYYAILYVQDSLGYKLMLSVKIIVKIDDLKKLNINDFKASFDCLTHSVKLDYTDDRMSLVVPSSENKEGYIEEFLPEDCSLEYKNDSMVISGVNGQMDVDTNDHLSESVLNGVKYDYYFSGDSLLMNPQDNKINFNTDDSDQLHVRTRVKLDDNYCGNFLKMNIQGDLPGQEITLSLGLPSNFLQDSVRSLSNLNDNRNKIEFSLYNNLTGNLIGGFLKKADGSDYEWFDKGSREIKHFLSLSPISDPTRYEFLHIDSFQDNSRPLFYKTKDKNGKNIIFNSSSPLGNLCLTPKELADQVYVSYWNEDNLNQKTFYLSKENLNRYYQTDYLIWPQEDEENQIWVETIGDKTYPVVSLESVHCTVTDKSGGAENLSVSTKEPLDLRVECDNGYHLPEQKIVCDDSIYPESWDRVVNGGIVKDDNSLLFPFVEFSYAYKRHMGALENKYYNIKINVLNIEALCTYDNWQAALIIPIEDFIGCKIMLPKSDGNYIPILEILMKEENDHE